VVLDKNVRITSIVNKTGNIENVFRTFPMEVLAGSDDMNVEVNHCGAKFRFDFSEVYWNSRLQMEHSRLVGTFTKKTVICDMMCGIGPFAIPAGKNGITVHANDLNPRSHHWLVENIARNRVGGKVTPYNMDARDFVRHLCGQKIPFTDVIMNLPATSIEFTDVFEDTFRRDWIFPTRPVIHCYCFSAEEDPAADAVKRIEAVMKCSIQGACSVHRVRDVAPRKIMLCVSFRLPGPDSEKGEQGPTKRQRVEDASSSSSSSNKAQ
jgi:tRNA (guanine37-N1)-methyltransferase